MNGKKFDNEFSPNACYCESISYDIMLKNWEKQKIKKFCKEGFVPSTLYFLVDDKNYIYGITDIRHYLNEYLLKICGIFKDESLVNGEMIQRYLIQK